MLTIEKVEKLFEDKTVLGPLTVELTEGKIYGLLGSNGSGKSTLLRCLSGIYMPDKGMIMEEGSPIFENETYKNSVYLVSDEPYFTNQSSMNSMAAFYKLFYDQWDEDIYQKLCSVFPLDPTARLHTFSKGMKRQASIILGISTSPKYFFVDEAFDGLDPVMRLTLKRILVDQIVEKEMLIVMTSHNIEEFGNICDEIIVLHHGKMVDHREVDAVNNIFKIRVAFEEAPTAEMFSPFDVKQLEIVGRMATLLIKGDTEMITKELSDLSPVYMEVLPSTLEEVFLYDMEEVNYHASELI